MPVAKFHITILTCQKTFPEAFHHALTVIGMDIFEDARVGVVFGTLIKKLDGGRATIDEVALAVHHGHKIGHVLGDEPELLLAGPQGLFTFPEGLLSQASLAAFHQQGRNQEQLEEKHEECQNDSVSILLPKSFGTINKDTVLGKAICLPSPFLDLRPVEVTYEMRRQDAGRSTSRFVSFQIIKGGNACLLA